jgi:hypothetical protein
MKKSKFRLLTHSSFLGIYTKDGIQAAINDNTWSAKSRFFDIFNQTQLEDLTL